MVLRIGHRDDGSAQNEIHGNNIVGFADHGVLREWSGNRQLERRRKAPLPKGGLFSIPPSETSECGRLGRQWWFFDNGERALCKIYPLL